MSKQLDRLGSGAVDFNRKTRTEGRVLRMKPAWDSCVSKLGVVDCITLPLILSPSPPAIAIISSRYQNAFRMSSWIPHQSCGFIYFASILNCEINRMNSFSRSFHRHLHRQVDSWNGADVDAGPDAMIFHFGLSSSKLLHFLSIFPCRWFSLTFFFVENRFWRIFRCRLCTRMAFVLEMCEFFPSHNILSWTMVALVYPTVNRVFSGEKAFVSFAMTTPGTEFPIK